MHECTGQNLVCIYFQVFWTTSKYFIYLNIYFYAKSEIINIFKI